MIPTSVIALFCDDIREEKSGALILIGILGDNVVVPPPPPDDSNLIGMIPKLGIYARVSFDVNADVQNISFKMTMPDGAEVDGGEISQEVLDRAKATRGKGNPIAGIVSRWMFGPVMMRKLGRITVEAMIDGQKYIAGTLNFITGQPS